ncbi:MAG: DUF2760 domain-containing protein [Myxococcales bacterium]|jgi:hypothetical protein
MTVSFSSRIGLAFRVLFDGELAARLTEPTPVPAPELPAPPVVAKEPSLDAALQLLSLLQREGRFVDFVQQDIAAFPDADIGAAARVVHEGCRRALSTHARVISVRSEAEGSSLTLSAASPDVKLVGNVAGSAPFRGVLRHRGWRVQGLSLPKLVGAQDPEVVAPAELELA